MHDGPKSIRQQIELICKEFKLLKPGFFVDTDLELGYGISIAVPLSDAVVDEILLENKPTHSYFHHYRTVNFYLDRCMLEIGLLLESNGYRYMPIGASQSIPTVSDPKGYHGRYSHKKAACLSEMCIRDSFWRTYANYIVLRVKDISSQLAEAVVEFSKQYLFDTPYRLTAGLVGEKAIAQESNSFGLQCAYLVWYAWQNFEVDLDSDGGRLVSPLDILLSDRVEVVQIYGINPNLFIE